MTKNKTLIYFFILLLVFLLGFLSCFLFYKGKKNSFYEVRKGNDKLVNPLLECGSGEEINEGVRKQLKNKLEDIIDDGIYKDKVTQVSIYYRDLNNGPWIGINEKESFSPASLLKVPLMMAYYKAAEKNPQLLASKIPYQKIDELVISQNIKPSKVLTTGKDYSVEDLIEEMIIYSDNQAKDTLFMYINQDELSSIYKDFGLKLPGVETSTEDYMTVKEYATFFRILFNASYLSEEDSNKALELLVRSDFKDGIVSGVPSNIKVAHKFGERATAYQNTIQLHDCGIVYYPKNPYLICIMTRGRQMSDLITMIKTLSQEVYKQVHNGY